MSKFSVLFVFLSFFLSNQLSAQCADFASNCIVNLKDYKHNGKLNSTTVKAGGETELLQRFNAGKKYRIVIGNKANLSNLLIEILDIKQNVKISKSSSEATTEIDFSPKKTEMLRIKVKIPVADNAEKSGCIAVLIGEK